MTDKQMHEQINVLLDQTISQGVCVFLKTVCASLLSEVCDHDHPACLHETWAGRDCHSGAAHYKSSPDGKMNIGDGPVHIAS